MPRVNFLQQWFNLSDPAVEEALYDSRAMRVFVGIDLGRQRLRRTDRSVPRGRTQGPRLHARERRARSPLTPAQKTRNTTKSKVRAKGRSSVSGHQAALRFREDPVCGLVKSISRIVHDVRIGESFYGPPSHGVSA